MPEIISCPQCERKLRVPEELLGQEVKCPTCGLTFTAPRDMGQAPPPPPPIMDEPRESRRDDPYREPTPSPRRSRRYQDDDEEEHEDYPSRRRRSRYSYGGYAPHRGSSILTLGILSLVMAVCCWPAGLVMGIIAAVMGGGDMTQIRNGTMDPEGEGSTRAGQICGIIGIILCVLAGFGTCLLQMGRFGQMNQFR